MEPTEPSRYPDLPRAMTAFGAVVVEGHLYVYGGHHGQAHHYSESGQSGDLLRLDLANPAAWERVTTGPKLVGLAMVAHGGKLYRIGGFTARNGDDEDQDLWSRVEVGCFDPQTGQWEELPPMSSPRSSFDAVVVGETLYVAGGWCMQGTREADWQESACSLDLASRPLRWEPLPNPPFRRRALSLGTLAGKVFAIGGMQPDGEMTTDVTIYDPVAKRWSEGPPLPGDDMEGFGTACVAAGGRVYVSTASGSVLRLAADGDGWEPVASLCLGRFFHRMVALSAERLLVIGGASMRSGKFADLEVVAVAT